MPIHKGATILNGKYRILRLIGEGGMARVWLAEELVFGNRPVAIKEPHAGLGSTDSEELRQRFQREVKVSAALEQAGTPNIVRAITAEPFEDGLLLVMEYMPGGDLEQRIRQFPQGMPLDEVVAVAEDMLTALAAVHNHPLDIVHRDIKPSNILFDAQGRARLADFGLAQVAGWSKVSRGREDMIGRAHPGTPTYMAPEQATEIGYLTPAADLYALGAVMFEMMTGKRYKRYRPGTRPSELRPGIPGWLDDLVVRAMAEEPFDRWPDAEAMKQALLAGGKGGGAGAGAKGVGGKGAGGGRSGQEGGSGERGRRWWIWVLLILLLLLISGGAWWGMTREKETPVAVAATSQTTTTVPTVTTLSPTSQPSTVNSTRTLPTSTPTIEPSPTPLPPTATPVPPTATPVLPTPTPIPLTDTPVPPDAIVSANELRMREGPGSNYAIIATYPRGVELEVLGKITNGDWLKVQSPEGKVGWMSAALLEVNIDLNAVPLAEVPPTPTPQYKAGDKRVSSIDGMTMVFIPEGSFVMGSATGEGDEQPQHSVHLSAYWIDQTEVTVFQYRKCVEAGACSPPHNGECTYFQSDQQNHPVNCLRWTDADAYCRWVGRRLPTEAEWEKAARGSDGRIFTWGNQFNGTLLNYCDVNCPASWKDSAFNDGYSYTAPAGSYPSGASPYGVLDMLGNEWEWVADWYDANYYGYAPSSNPTGPNSGEKKVARGGSWNTGRNDVRAANRYSDYPDSRGAYYGFRCALSQ